MRAIINKLPEVNRKCLMHITNLCHEISLHEEINKMSQANLAICWAPNLIRPMNESSNTILDVSTVRDAMTFILEQYKELGVPLCFS